MWVSIAVVHLTSVKKDYSLPLPKAKFLFLRLPKLKEEDVSQSTLRALMIWH